MTSGCGRQHQAPKRFGPFLGERGQPPRGFSAAVAAHIGDERLIGGRGQRLRQQRQPLDRQIIAYGAELSPEREEPHVVLPRAEDLVCCEYVI